MRHIPTVSLAAAGALLAGASFLATRNRAYDRKLDDIWRSLERPGSGEVFRPEMVDDLPPAARRYFLHAIAPGTPLAGYVSLRMHGTLKPGPRLPWLPLTARQIIAPGCGFLWRVNVRRGPFFLSGADYYAGGEGRIRLVAWGLAPVLDAQGPDLSQSAAGRLLIESIWLPAALLPQRGTTIEGQGEDKFNVTVGVDGFASTLTIVVDEEGRPREVLMQRYGNQTDDGHWGLIPYGAAIDAERAFGGYTVPSEVRAAWWYGTEKQAEAIRFTVDEAAFDRSLSGPV